MLNWSLKEIDLPLKFVWKISRNASTVKRNFIVEVKNDNVAAQGEVAFNVRFGESEEQIREMFDKFKNSITSDISSVEDLVLLLEEINLPRSLRFGIESAFIHFLANLSQRPVSELLGVKSVNLVKTSFSLPILPIGDIGDFISKYNLGRFHSLKLKVNKDTAVDIVREVVRHYSGNLRVDANEAWSDPDDVIKYVREIGANLPIEFVEQPLAAGSDDEYLYLKDKVDVDIVADESLTSGEVTTYFKDRFHGVNVKLMKAGGYLSALRQLQAIRGLGLKTMIGCMIETSLGISSAMNIAYGVDYLDLDGHLIIENDPFNLVVEENGRLFFSHIQ